MKPWPVIVSVLLVAGCGGSPAAPSDPGGRLDGTWRGRVEITPRGQPVATWPATVTFNRTAGNPDVSASYEAEITTSHPFIQRMVERARTSLVLPVISINGRFYGPTGTECSFNAFGDVNTSSSSISTSLNGTCHDLGNFSGFLNLSR
jgi:hypothetical protein